MTRQDSDNLACTIEAIAGLRQPLEAMAEAFRGVATTMASPAVRAALRAYCARSAEEVDKTTH